MYKGGWKETGVVGVGGQAEGKFSLLLGTNSGTVFSVGDKDKHVSQARLRWIITAV